MKNKKNIDDLFRKGFENFESSPSPEVWENIQTKLKEEKKDRKVIPLWIKIGSIAAGLALLLSVGNWVFDSSNFNPNAITSEDSIIMEQDEPSQSRSIEQVVSAEEVQVSKEKESNKINQDFDKNSHTNTNNAQSAVASDQSIQKHQKSLTDKSQKQTVKPANKEILPSNKTEEAIVVEQTKVEQTNKGIQTKQDFISEKEAVALKDSGSDKNIEKEKVSENNISIFDAIAEKKEQLSKEESKKESRKGRWNIAPVVAPVYYSSLGNGSSLDPDFSNNPQSGDVNMSYGIQVGYDVSKRLSIRTGVNNVGMSYSTSGVEVASAPVARGLSSVNYNGLENIITVFNKGTVPQDNQSGGEFSNINLKSTGGNTRLIQNINYYEVPVELKYALLNEKFGVNIIGGLSTLFLNNNEVSVKAENFSAVLGEANNLSSVSFSTNIGLGLDYKISKQFTFNIEPMFKYQLNPYTDSSVDFKPYYIGVYSGLNFRF